MATNKFLNTSELDFDEIKSNLKTFLSNQDILTDYDFEGSNMAVLMDLLAYNTNMLAFYLNMTGSEMFLDSAQLRESVNSKAKQLNYLPRSKYSSQAVVTFSIVPDDEPDYITIPKFYNILASSSDGTVNFLTDDVITIQRSLSGEYVSSNVTIYEGRFVEEYFTANVVNNKYQNRFILQSENVDTRSIDVRVFNSSTDNVVRTFSKADSLYNLDSTSLKYFIQPYANNQFEVVFGDGVFGTILDNENLIHVRYRDTIGKDGDNYVAFTKSSDIDGYSGITINTVEKSAYGAERESIDSIKFNAVRHFETQERGVVTSDYISLVKANFPEIQSVVAYGGEVIGEYGKIIISVKPHGTQNFINSSLKNRIITFLSSKNVTVEPKVVDPIFFYTKLNIKAQYDSSVNVESLSTLKSNIISSLENLNNTTLLEFGADLRYSTLLKTIDDAHESIISNKTDVWMVKRWTPLVNVDLNYEINFNVNVENHGGTYNDSHDPVFYSTKFTHVKDGVEYDAYLRDDGIGKIKMHYDSGGNRLTLYDSVGTIDYLTGKINLSTKIKGYFSRIDLILKPKDQHVVVTENRYISISGSDINIEFEDVRE